MRKLMCAALLALASAAALAAEPAGKSEEDSLSGDAWKECVVKKEAPEQKALRDEMKSYKPRIIFQRIESEYSEEDKKNKKAFCWRVKKGATWDIFIINADGSGLANITNTPDVSELLAHASPDGTKFVYTAVRSEGAGDKKAAKSAVICRDIDGKNPVVIAEDAQHGCWTPDGKGITYTKNSKQKGYSCFNTEGVYTCDLATKKETPINNGDKAKGAFNLCWSPDGKYLSYFAKYQGGNDTMDVETGWRGRLWGCRSDWSPDGTRLAWNRNDAELIISAIHKENMKADANSPWIDAVDKQKKPDEMIITSHYECYFADWSPDGKYIVYSRSTGGGANYELGGGGEWNVAVVRTTRQKGPWGPAVTVQLTFERNIAMMEPDWVPTPAK